MNKTILISIALLMSGAVSAAPPTAPQSPPADVLAALPDDPQIGLRLEAALVFRDLRTFVRNTERSREVLRQTKLGNEFYTQQRQQQALGFDPFEELKSIIALTNPSGQPVPAGVAAFSGPMGPGAQLLLHVEAGAIERLASALGSANPPAWKGRVVDGALQIDVGNATFIGKVDENGWLRIGPTEPMLVDGNGTQFFETKMSKWTQDCDGLLFARGGGMLAGMLASRADGPVAPLLQSMRAIAVGWKHDGEKTSITRLLVDIPELEQIREVARPPELANSLAAVWGDHLSGFGSISLPPVFTTMLLPILQRELQSSDIQLPDELTQGLALLDGRIGFVSFDAPGDWALGIGFKDANAVTALIPAMKDWWVQVAAKLETDVSDNYALEAIEGAGPVLHMRPGVGLEGPRMAAIGNTLVVVNAKHRLDTLLQRQKTLTEKPSEARPVAGPVTAPIRDALNSPAMILGYMLASSEGDVFEYLSWTMGSALQGALTATMGSNPYFDLLKKVANQLPTYLVLEGITWSLMYDMTLWADLDGSVLVVQLLNSEI
ncbi:MAG: hypothetical protein A2289_10095 [Deltaproteobacteria bacterium RIFOXYA12_FULL_58_15]|nr:MAG: hypothetical protein A2289_10095 [Deltaproteobacteria bacterium RIFOXYA12_FULL_58_15]OGR08176.1 MAG: hypothetical protein A2341_20140 [Deltaproteobacteria bacterium RIFOXYB12_FULL_58_9]